MQASDAMVYCVACSHSPQMFPCGSTMAATAPTPGTGIFGRATVAPHSLRACVETTWNFRLVLVLGFGWGRGSK